MRALVLDPAVIDLGKDRDRMTAKAANEQHASVNRLLGAFYGPIDERREVRLLADEVGLGKTFVALALAYATLAALREKFRPCQRVPRCGCDDTIGESRAGREMGR